MTLAWFKMCSNSYSVTLTALSDIRRLCRTLFMPVAMRQPKAVGAFIQGFGAAVYFPDDAASAIERGEAI